MIHRLGRVFSLSLGMVLTMSTIIAAENERLLLADGLYERAFYTDAISEYQQVLKDTTLTESQRKSAQSNLADSLSQTGRATEAIAIYQSLLSVCDETTRNMLHLRLATAYLSAKQPQEALSLLQTITDTLDPQFKPLHRYSLAIAYEQLDRDDDAIEQYRALTSPTNDYSEASMMRLADLLGMRTQDAAAVREATGYYFDIAIKSKDPQRAIEAYAAAAILTYTTGHYDESARLHMALFRKNPQALKARKLDRSAAWACIKANRYSDAALFVQMPEAESSLEPDERLYLTATLSRQLKQTSKAEAAYQKLIVDYPASQFLPYACSEWLTLLYTSGDYAGFLKRAPSFLDRVPKADLEFLFRLQMEAAVAMEQDALASETALRMTRAFPQGAWTPVAHYKLAWLIQKQGELAQAAEAYAAIVTTYPHTEIAPEALYASAYCFATLKQYDKAQQALSSLLVDYPKSKQIPAALLLKAGNELRQQQTPRATTSLEELIERFPEAPQTAEAQYLLGLVYFNQKAFTEALALLKNACDRGLPYEQATEAAIKQAQALYHLNRQSEAAELLQKILGAKQMESLSPSYLCWLVDFWLERNDPVAAELAATQLVRSAKEPADRVLAYLYKGRLAEARGEKASAIDAYTQAIDCAGEQPSVADAEVALNLGRLLFQQRELASAEANLQRTVSLTATQDIQSRRLRAEAYALLAELTEADNRPDEALRYNMSLIILFDDKILVPPAFIRASKLVASEPERLQLLAELKTRYPDSKQARSLLP